MSGLSIQTKKEFTQNNKRIANGIIRKWHVKEQQHDLSEVELKEINIVLFGRTGAGKSATEKHRNSGARLFSEVLGTDSHNKENKVGEFEREGIKLRVIDTPGLFDTRKGVGKGVTMEIGKVIHTFKEGIHAFVYVHNPDERFTIEHEETAMTNIKVYPSVKKILGAPFS